MDRARALTPPLGQWPAGWQLHTLMLSVLVLDRAGVPLSLTTTGSRNWLWSRRRKELLRAMMLAVLSAKSQDRDVRVCLEAPDYSRMTPGSKSGS